MSEGNAPDLDLQILDAAAALKHAMEKFGAEHPDVLKLKQEYNDLQEQKVNGRRRRPRHTEELEKEGIDTKRWRRSGRFRKYSQETGKSKAGIFLGVGVVAAIAFIPVVIYGGEKYYELFPDEKQASEIIQKANEYFNHENYEGAEAEFKRAIRLSPKDAELRYRYGTSLSKMGLPNEAAEQFKEAVKLNPKKKKYLMSAGSELMSLVEYEQAAEMYGSLADQFKNDASGSYWAAVCYEKIGKPERAVELYKQSAGVGPEFDACWYDWARLLRKNGKRQDALVVLNKGITNHPKNGWLRYHRGLLYSEMGKTQEALADMRMAATLDPSQAENASDIINQLEKGKKVETYLVALKPVEDRLYVNARLDNKLDVKLLVDSGAEICVISPQSAKTLDLDVESAQDIGVEGVTGTDMAKAGLMEQISVGKANAKEVEVMVYDTNDSHGADGLLGMSFLKNFVFSIDSQHNLLELRPKSAAFIAKEQSQKIKKPSGKEKNKKKR